MENTYALENQSKKKFYKSNLKFHASHCKKDIKVL